MDVGAVCGVEASLDVAFLKELGSDEVAFEACVLADGDSGDLDSILDDSDSCDFSLSKSRSLCQIIETLRRVKQGRSSSRHDSLRKRSSSGAESISNSILDLSNFNLTASSDLNHSNSALQLRQSLLQLLLIIAALGDLDLFLDDLRSALDLSPE